MSGAPRARRRAIVLAGAGIPLAALIGAAGLGEALSRPVQHRVGLPPPELAATPVTLRTASNAAVAGWLARGEPGHGAVLLLHGVRGDRRSMQRRAIFLNRLGYTVMLIDLPGHGESPAPQITFGLNESHGVTAALAAMAEWFPRERVGVIGVSLGAASLVLSRPDPAPAAVVLESMYPTITEAVADRLALHVGSFARPLAPALLWQMPLRLGVSPSQLRPIVDLEALHCPLLIAAGSLDRHTTLPETLRIYAAANEPKQLWIVDGAAHVDLHDFDPAGYERRIETFLAAHLRARAATGTA